MIPDRDVATLLRAATDDLEIPSAPAEALAEAGHRRLVRRNSVGAAAAVAAVAAVAFGATLTGGSQQNAPTTAAHTSATAPPPADCLTTVPDAVLPAWARAGFSDRKPRIAYVLGGNGDIVAIFFAQPLTSPPAADQNNKILWVSRVPQDPLATLRIDARLAGGTAAVTRRVAGGPGPSIIDLPEPGCWHLTLHWNGHIDGMDLYYFPR